MVEAAFSAHGFEVKLFCSFLAPWRTDIKASTVTRDRLAQDFNHVIVSYVLHKYIEMGIW